MRGLYNAAVSDCQMQYIVQPYTSWPMSKGPNLHRQ